MGGNAAALPRVVNGTVWQSGRAFLRLDDGALAMVNLIRQARQTRGWTSAKLNAEIRQTARKLGVSTASQESLRVMISSWENGRQTPDATYQRPRGRQSQLIMINSSVRTALRL
jgi:hypothetical protein